MLLSVWGHLDQDKDISSRSIHLAFRRVERPGLADLFLIGVYVYVDIAIAP